MKQQLLTILRFIFQKINMLFVAIKVIKPKVIIYMDGGICSQMNMYINGQYYRDYPIDIYYDIDWFRRCGKDMDGKFDRLFELTTMFPNLPFQTISKWKSKFYKLLFQSKDTDGYLPEPKLIKKTVYFYGYYTMHNDEYNHLFNQIFLIDNIPFNTHKHICHNKDIVNCAIHVRRGDLAYREFDWYKSTPNIYFFDSIDYVKRKYHNVVFYFFSDEPDWVDTNICSHIDAEYKIVRNNKAYEDLLLISECDVVVASQGSLGRVGAKLNGKSELITLETLYENFSSRNNL